MVDLTTPPPPEPDIPLVAGDDKSEDEVDEDPPADEPDLQREHRDADSSYGDDTGSIMNYGSVAESIYNFRMQYGRTYHSYKEGKYHLPNDEMEQFRMNLAYHSLCRMFDGKSFFSPVENPQRIVDIGTGTGVWAIDVADEYPSAQVVGTDLSPIQPRWVPQNCEFRIDDLELPWTFEQPLDLVHSRICSGLAIKDWPKYLSESYRCLRPGGWVEAQEFSMQVVSDDDSIPPDSAMAQWHDVTYQGMLSVGSDMRISSQQIKTYMKEAGFVNVQVIDFKWPISAWPREPKLKECGAIMKQSMFSDMRGLGTKIFREFLGWSIKEMDSLLEKVEQEWDRDDIHGYWPLHVVYGQKPGSEQ